MTSLVNVCDSNVHVVCTGRPNSEVGSRISIGVKHRRPA